jgi:hypothetical protein
MYITAIRTMKEIKTAQRGDQEKPTTVSNAIVKNYVGRRKMVKIILGTSAVTKVETTATMVSFLAWRLQTKERNR